ncbi:MAG: hypothetical protein QNL33_00800 [Akkermansiaceae bacterium]|jgi:hypothetical protein
MRAHVFAVKSEFKPIKLEGITSLKQGQSKIEVKLPGACVITVTNAKVKRFIRRGLNQNNGASQMDTFLVDEKGNVDPKTPIIWDFDELTGITVQPVDKEPLTITGGRFTTIANTRESGTYHARGILIQRSNVIVEGVQHDIRGEGEHGSPYHGFISISSTFGRITGAPGVADIIIRNCRFSPHRGGSSPSVFGGFNDGQHDFGYTSSMPARILIDKLHIEDAGKNGGPTLFANFNPKLTSDSYKQKHPYVVTREVILKNVTTASSKSLRLSDNPYMFRDVQVEGLGQ